jgi:peptidyl-dipeptidase A
MKYNLLLTAAFIAALFGAAGCKNAREVELEKIIKETQAKVEPLRIQANLASWNGDLSGKPEDFAKSTEAQLALKTVYSDKATFAKIKAIRESGMIRDKSLARQCEVLYENFLQNQADTSLLRQIADRETALAQKYASFRAVYKGQKINDNQVEELLHKSTDNAELEAVWKAHKAIGALVAPDIIEVVKLRNKLAKSLGFDNYHAMSLELSEEDPKEIDKLLDQMDSISRDAFAEVKKEMDDSFAVHYKVPADKLMPWNYQGRFFQEAPNLYPVDIDKYYANQDLGKLMLNFYHGIGIDLDSILAHSDVFPREGKNQHAYCTDIDSKGDIRVLANCVSDSYWMDTMLHEFGHASYAQGHDIAENPYFLRDAAGIFTTEGIAMMFGRLSRNPYWIQGTFGIADGERDSIAANCNLSSRLQQLVFSRWVQVVYRFEESMYANPDQDLNALWWQLVEKYQLLKTPEGREGQPDWASKIHIALYPCYYHNYLMGEMFASQVHHYIVTELLKEGEDAIPTECYINNPKVGAWLKEEIFKPGRLYSWDELMMRATGENLTPKYWKEQFIGK